MTRDLTKGSPMRNILGFAVPIFLGLLLQQVYNLADTVIVGRFVGADALGGVGSTNSLNFLVLGSCIGLCMGFGIPAANAFGAGDYARLRRYVANSVYVCAALGAAIMAVVLIFCRPILSSMHTTAETYDYAYGYIYWIFWGIPFVMLYNMTSAVIRAVGDSKSPVLFLAIAAGINVALDLAFILILRMGVEGAAIATDLSQGISGALCLIYLRRKLPILRMQPGDRAFSWRIAGHLVENGLPMALQYAITAIGSILLQSAVNALGTVYVNAAALSGKLYQMLACPYDALGTTMATYAGQNTGAGQPARIRRGLGAAMLISAVCSAGFFLAARYFTPQMCALFLSDPQPGVVALAQQQLLAFALASFLLAGVNVYRFALQGIGYSYLAIISGVIEMLARALAALAVVPALGFTGVCLASPAAWVFADCFLVPACYLCLGRLKKRLQEAARVRALAENAAP